MGTSNERDMLLNSSDFFGINHYSSNYGSPGKSSEGGKSFFADVNVTMSSDPTWQKTDMGWNVVPFGFRKLLQWIHKRYNPMGGIIVTENGCAVNETCKEVAIK